MTDAKFHDNQFAFVTTFSDSGFERYGKKMMASFEAYMSAPLYFVKGSDFTSDIHASKVTVIDNAFDERVMAFMGDCADLVNNNFEYAPHRFIHKPTALLSVLQHLQSQDSTADYMVWLDGDSVILKDDLSDKLAQIAPSADQIAAFFDRTYAYHYCEAGIVIFNLKSPKLQALLEKWSDIFLSKDIFEYREWHDAFLLTWLADAYAPGSFRMICQEFGLKTTHPIAEFRLISSSIDHLKGDERKAVGVSLERMNFYGNFGSKVLRSALRIVARLRG